MKYGTCCRFVLENMMENPSEFQMTEVRRGRVKEGHKHQISLILTGTVYKEINHIGHDAEEHRED